MVQEFDVNLGCEGENDHFEGSGQRDQPIEPLEDWEVDPGTMTGEIILWELEHEYRSPTDDEPICVTESRVAVSSGGIKTRMVLGASFLFTKTLTMPFMDAGVVDSPPGTEKRPKNSRKMHMVFFVHYGKALVAINDTLFRITAGGMWFVPRGNYYSIINDYDDPCRIFFSQGYEILVQQDPDFDTLSDSSVISA